MTESADRFSPRIDAIETQWSMVRRAHQGTMTTGGEAKNALIMRYSPAVRSYIRAMTGSDTEADELSQEVVIRILKGDFAGADPNRGRFRDLLKVAVRNMVRNHWAKENRRRPVDIDQVHTDEVGEEHTQEDPWLDSWRYNVLELAWAALKNYEEQREGRIAYTVLKLRAEHPTVDSESLAGKLSEVTGKTYRADTTRQQLRRARIRFAEFLVEEIAQGLEQSDPNRIQEELIALGLYENIRDVLPEQWKSD